MKINHYNRRKYWKKLQRKRKRIHRAQLRDKDITFSNDSDDQDEQKEINIEEIKWIAREREAQENWNVKQKLDKIQLPVFQNSISIPFDNELPKASKKLASSTEPLYRLPDLPSELADSKQTDREICQFYRKTGACRFDLRCSRTHERPMISDTLLLLNMFSSSDTALIPGDADISLEHDESQLRQEYEDFYEDVYSELASFGRVVTLRTCRNAMKHLRGNVYVQYRNINDAIYALHCLSGRYFGGKPISGRLVAIESWRESICGLFHRGRCPKGPICNFLHVFLNTGETTNDLLRFLNISRPRTVDPVVRRRRRARRGSNSSTCSSISGGETPEKLDSRPATPDIPRGSPRRKRKDEKNKKKDKKKKDRSRSDRRGRSPSPYRRRSHREDSRSSQSSSSRHRRRQ